MNALLSVEESSMPLFVDAYLLDGERWVFGSFWGNETALQEFFARLTLPNHEQGLRAFTVRSEEGERTRIVAGNVGDLTKVTGKTPPTTVLGALCNVWIFDPTLQTPNHGNGEAYIIGTPSETRAQLWLRAWEAVQTLSHIPLLNHWRNDVMELLSANEWLTPLAGVGVQGIKVSLPIDDLEREISQGVKNGTFPLAHDTTPATTMQSVLF